VVGVSLRGESEHATEPAKSTRETIYHRNIAAIKSNFSPGVRRSRQAERLLVCLSAMVFATAAVARRGSIGSKSFRSDSDPKSSGTKITPRALRPIKLLFFRKTTGSRRRHRTAFFASLAARRRVTSGKRERGPRTVCITRFRRC